MQERIAKGNCIERESAPLYLKEEFPTPANMKTLLLLLMSSIGLYVSTFFTLVYYGWIQSDAKYVPQVCRLDEGGCQRLLHHRHARLFGIPNSFLGILYYVGIILVVTFYGDSVIISWVTYLSWMVVAIGVYLVYSLIFIVKTPCVLCFFSHALNTLIAIVLVV